MARGPQKTTRLVRGGPLVTIILSNRTITTHNNGQYKTHYRYSRKSKTFVLNDDVQGKNWSIIVMIPETIIEGHILAPVPFSFLKRIYSLIYSHVFKCY